MGLLQFCWTTIILSQNQKFNTIVWILDFLEPKGDLFSRSNCVFTFTYTIICCAHSSLCVQVRYGKDVFNSTSRIILQLSHSGYCQIILLQPTPNDCTQTLRRDILKQLLWTLPRQDQSSITCSLLWLTPQFYSLKGSILLGKCLTTEQTIYLFTDVYQ